MLRETIFIMNWIGALLRRIEKKYCTGFLYALCPKHPTLLLICSNHQLLQRSLYAFNEEIDVCYSSSILTTWIYLMYFTLLYHWTIKRSDSMKCVLNRVWEKMFCSDHHSRTYPHLSQRMFCIQNTYGHSEESVLISNSLKCFDLQNFLLTVITANANTKRLEFFMVIFG